MNKPLLQESALVRREATEVLRLTDIEHVLADFGEVHLIGSYAYNVMVAKDIDFHIIVKAFSLELVKNFFQYAADSKLFEYISFHDKHTFNVQAAARYPAGQALDSYYFGLRLQHNGNEWQIGMNFITKPQEISVEIVRLFYHATDEQREYILAAKKALHDKNVRVSSAFIYRAVLERNFTNLDDIYTYLRTIGYVID